MTVKNICLFVCLFPDPHAGRRQQERGLAAVCGRVWAGRASGPRVRPSTSSHVSGAQRTTRLTHDTGGRPAARRATPHLYSTPRPAGGIAASAPRPCVTPNTSTAHSKPRQASHARVYFLPLIFFCARHSRLALASTAVANRQNHRGRRARSARSPSQSARTAGKGGGEKNSRRV